MIRYLAVPQLPQGSVSSLALGQRYVPTLQKPLEQQGIEVFSIPEAPELDARIASHADLLLLHLGQARFAVREACRSSWLPPEYIEVPNNKEESVLNCCAVGTRWFCCAKTEAVLPMNGDIHYVNQRYARCSVCIVDEHSIITADRGMAKAAAAAGLEVLLIEPGHISLPGYDTGFIGGASFKLSCDTLAFTGVLDAHPDKRRIQRFLRSRAIEPLYLTDEPLFDVGSAVLLTESIPD